VLDVPPKLAARVRLLGSGATGKNDPNDARSVAVAALRSPACPPVRADDHTAVLKVWAKRHRDLSRSRNQVVCRLHAVLRPGPRRRQQAHHRRPGRPGPRAGPAARRRRGGPLDTGRAAADRPAPHRSPARAAFAAYNGTAPTEVSSGGRVLHRLSLRGNRRMNHAVHMAAVTQVRYPGSQGRA
jgi:transposase